MFSVCAVSDCRGVKVFRVRAITMYEGLPRHSRNVITRGFLRVRLLLQSFGRRIQIESTERVEVAVPLYVCICFDHGRGNGSSDRGFS